MTLKLKLAVSSSNVTSTESRVTNLFFTKFSIMFTHTLIFNFQTLIIISFLFALFLMLCKLKLEKWKTISFENYWRLVIQGSSFYRTAVQVTRTRPDRTKSINLQNYWYITSNQAFISASQLALRSLKNFLFIGSFKKCNKKNSHSGPACGLNLILRSILDFFFWNYFFEKVEWAVFASLQTIKQTDFPLLHE